MATGSGLYRGSEEELTPLRHDWPSIIPLSFAAAWLLVNPAAAEKMPQKGWGSHLLTPNSVRRTEAMALPTATGGTA